MPLQSNRSPHGVVAATLFSLGTILFGGCGAPSSRLSVIDFSEDGSANRYVEDFDEAYYDIDAHGNIDLILRRTHSGRMSGEPDLTQIVHVHGVWRSIPGQTIAHDEQINATVNYAIRSAATGHTFEGAGSIFFKSREGKDVLTGQLGRAVLKPVRQVSQTRPVFSRAEVSGSFRAIRDPHHVVLIKNDLRRIFGARPVG